MLSEAEVELQQPGIQKYLDKYEELLRAENAEDEEENDDEDADRLKDKTTIKEREGETNPEDTHNEDGSHKDAHRRVQTAKAQSDSQTSRTQAKEDGTGGVMKEQASGKAATPSASKEAVEDEDDGVEIEVVEEMEIVEDDGRSQEGSFAVPVYAAGVVGVLTVLVIVIKRARAAQQVKVQQRAGE